MIAAPGFYSNSSFTMTTSSTDSTDSCLRRGYGTCSITLTYSSNDRANGANFTIVLEDELKAEMRSRSRKLTLIAQAELAELHDQERPLKGHQRRYRCRRPTKRRTCTAVQNFRGRP
jgi:hypothetical protein